MTTFNAQVAADNDDAYEYGGIQEDTNTKHWWNFSDSSSLHGGSRFNSVTVAQGALIEAGTNLELTAENSGNNDVSFNIHADDVDDSEVIEGGGTDLDLRTKTTAFVTWSALDISAAVDDFTATPDITTVIQEVIDRGGWSSGADLTIIGEDVQSSLRFASRDYSHASLGPATITIIYTAGGSSSLVSPRLKIGVGL